MTDQLWMTANEAASYLKVQPRSLLLWVRQGKLKAYALSGTKRRVWRFLKGDLDAALLSRPVMVSSDPSLPVRSDERRVI
jgi:excisionase family DNA binding protein